MSPWLYEHIIEGDRERRPSFSVQAINNWFQALRYEINQTHGESIEDQITSCRQFFRSKRKINNIHKFSDVFESLFFSITYSMTLERFANNLNLIPWIRCTAIVDWYYSIYFSFRSMGYSLNQIVPTKHSRMASFVSSTLKTSLPYPLDIKAHREAREKYIITVHIQNPATYDLHRPFYFSRPFAQGMLAQYLKGTANWYAENTKRDILRENRNSFSNFRSDHAKKIRDDRLLNEVGFLHCAYRQRVKANYKDSIYLSYNFGEDVNLDSLIDNLSVSARFTSIAAIAFAERKIGKYETQAFIADLRMNLRGINNSSLSEKYWSRFT